MKRLLIVMLTCLMCIGTQAQFVGKTVDTQAKEWLIRVSEFYDEYNSFPCEIIGINLDKPTNLVIPKKLIDKDGRSFYVDGIARGAFKSNPYITTVKWENPDDGDYICDEAFEECPNLETVWLPSKARLTNGVGLFRNCKKLDAVYLNGKPMTEEMFAGCEKLMFVESSFNSYFGHNCLMGSPAVVAIFKPWGNPSRPNSVDGFGFSQSCMLVVLDSNEKPIKEAGWDKVFPYILTKTEYLKCYGDLDTLRAYASAKYEKEQAEARKVKAQQPTKPYAKVTNLSVDEGAKAWTSNLYRGLTVVFGTLTVGNLPTEDIFVKINFYDAAGKPLEAVEYTYRDGSGHCVSMLRYYTNYSNPAKLSNLSIQIPYTAVWKGYGAKNFKYQITVSGMKTGVLWKSSMKAITITNRPRPRGRFL